MKRRHLGVVLTILLAAGLLVAAGGPSLAAGPLPAKAGFNMKTVARGHYLVKISGCNDCHTPGYVQQGGTVPETLWLTGDNLGWSGPWGTTYAANLRLFMNSRTEKQWVTFARTMKTRPPMPWFTLNAMRTNDLRAMYQFIRYLGPAGTQAPSFVPPGQDPQGPRVTFPAPPKG
jgi:mono/diheme cytochrome c family protein